MHSQDHLSVPRQLPFLAGCSLILICALSVLAACGASTLSGPAAHATATARAQTAATTAAQATHAAEPVLLAIQVTQQGTLAQNNAHLLVTLTVTNQTDQTIHLTVPRCLHSALAFEVHNAKSQTLWASYVYPGSCPSFVRPFDERVVSAGNEYTTTINGDLALVTKLGVPKLQAGIPYTILGKLWIWHQGTLDQFMQSEALSGNDLTVSVPFTLS